MTYWEKRSVQFTLRRMRDNKALYIMMVPMLLYFALFHYWPMYGIQIAFKNFLFIFTV